MTPAPTPVPNPNPRPTPAWPQHLEPALLPYQALPACDIRPLLVLAPHPDDEVLACGGLLALAASRGVRAQVIVLSDGGLGGDAATREAESLAAAQVLGGALARQSTQFWRLPDRGLQPGALLQQRIAQAIETSRAEWVLAPSPFEIHPDHRAVCQASIAAVRERCSAGQPVQLVCCEIGQPLLPNALIDITSVAALKARALRCFASQLAQQAYDEQIMGLNRYRAYSLGPAVACAEALWFVPEAAVMAGLPGVLAALGEMLQARAR